MTGVRANSPLVCLTVKGKGYGIMYWLKLDWSLWDTHGPVSVCCRRPSSTMLKHLLLQNRLPVQSQILYRASFVRGNKILFVAPWSHDKDGRHAHILYKTFKNLLLRNWRADLHETWYVASVTPAHHSLFK